MTFGVVCYYHIPSKIQQSWFSLSLLSLLCCFSHTEFQIFSAKATHNTWEWIWIHLYNLFVHIFKLHWILNEYVIWRPNPACSMCYYIIAGFFQVLTTILFLVVLVPVINSVRSLKLRTARMAYFKHFCAKLAGLLMVRCQCTELQATAWVHQQEFSLFLWKWEIPDTTIKTKKRKKMWAVNRTTCVQMTTYKTRIWMLDYENARSN